MFYYIHTLYAHRGIMPEIMLKYKQRLSMPIATPLLLLLIPVRPPHSCPNICRPVRACSSLSTILIFPTISSFLPRCPTRQASQMSHSRSAMRTIPGFLHLTHVPHNLLHLTYCQCFANHDAASTGSHCEHPSHTSRPHNAVCAFARSVAFAEKVNQLFEVGYSKGRSLACGQ